MKANNLGEIISFNSSFKTAINLYLSLNKTDKVLSYIPTKSSVRFMDEYLEAIIKKKEHATLLVGPYGKGKSHLLLVLLAVLSLERTPENAKVVRELQKKIKTIDELGNKAVSDIEKAWKAKRFLPVIINDTKGDLHQSFLIALSDALKRAGLDSLAPDTFYSEALRRMDEWEADYPETLRAFEKTIKKHGYTIKTMRASLNRFDQSAIEMFRKVYPTVTAGSEFNPLAASDVLPLYKSVSEKLVEDYNYSGVYIVFDEFSKFIEGLDGTRAGNTMKLLQDMCELAEDSSDAQIYLTMVAHKSIKEYGKYLSPEIINAFTGIEGRIQERFFVTSSKNNYELIKSAIIKDPACVERIPGSNTIFSAKRIDEYYQLPAFKSNFDRSDFENVIYRGCYPLNPIAAFLLMNISEKVAQNERTLFTFISNDEPHSLARFVSEHDGTNGWIVGADLVYDYFSGLFKKEVTNELVHNIWLGAEYAIAKCENEDEKRLIKTLALIHIVNKGDEIPANDSYLSLASSLDDSSEPLRSLIDKQLIYKKSSINAYVFKTRAGSELKAELKKQRELKGDNCNYSKALQSITGRYFVIPRKYNTEKMMTRYFNHEYMDVEVFLSISDANVFFDKREAGDGKVLSLYGLNRYSCNAVKEHFKELNCGRLVVVLPKETFKAVKAVKDYEILQGIKADREFISTNAVLNKEIPLLEEDIVKTVEDELNTLYSAEETRVFYWSKGNVKTADHGQEEHAVNECCMEIYSKTPVINNEIINRSVISTGQTKKARLNIIDAILKGADNEDFYAGSNQEATVYRALFGTSEIGTFDVDNNLEEVKGLINDFVNQCSDQKVCVSTVIDKLVSAPYGMRMGVIPIYFAKVLSERNEDLVVYFSDLEVQVTPEIIVNMCEQADEYSLFVSKADIQKEEYINNLKRLFDVENNRALTENRIKNIVLCMQRWYRALPQITRNLAGIEEYGYDDRLKDHMKSMKKIMQKVDLNPYEILFSTIPQEFGTADLGETFVQIEECYDGFNGYLAATVKQVVDCIYSCWGGNRKHNLYHLLREWYEKQSQLSKQGLHSGGVTNLMSCIEKLEVCGDEIVAQKIVKAVTNVYVDNWLDNAYSEFVEELAGVKSQIEQIRDEKEEGKLLLSFYGSKGEKIERYYEKVSEGTGTILRNIIEDTLDEYDDLSVNDRVAILLEMIEKVIG